MEDVKKTLTLEISEHDSALIVRALLLYAKTGDEGYVSAHGCARFIEGARSRRGWKVPFVAGKGWDMVP